MVQWVSNMSVYQYFNSLQKKGDQTEGAEYFGNLYPHLLDFGQSGVMPYTRCYAESEAGLSNSIDRSQDLVLCRWQQHWVYSIRS